MTTNDSFDGRLAAWLREDGEHRVPDHLGEVLVTSAATRQRPWWASPERWLPMDLTSRASTLAFPRMGRLIVIGLLIIALAALAVIAVGSWTQRLPPPFGPARNGAIMASHDGDIFRIDPTTAQATLVIGGADAFDFSPVFSRDGTKFVFLRSDGPLGEPAMLSLMVANADGSGVRAATPPVESLDWFDWSPSGTQVAYMSAGDLWVVAVDGSRPVKLDTGPAHFPTWLPPDGNEIVFRLEASRPGIYAIRPDGSGRQRELSRTPANDPSDYQSIAASPDGSHITFTRWSTAGIPSVFALDVTTGEETAFAAPLETGQRGPVVYSPDGTLVAYAQLFRDGAFQLVVASSDGSGGQRAIGPRIASPPDDSDVAATWAFTPDGTALIVRYGSDDTGTTQRLPIDGSPGSILDSGAFDFVDVQRLAP
jgi:Tol biopolymer transport system component